MDEVDVDPVDLCLELRQRVQPRRAPAHVVIGCPVASDFQDRLQLYALRSIRYELAAGPSGRRDAAAQFVQILVREADSEWPDISGRWLGVHGRLLYVRPWVNIKVRKDGARSDPLHRVVVMTANV